MAGASIDGAEDGASIKSAATTKRTRASPKRGGGDGTGNQKRTIDYTFMAPLPIVKPIEYEEFLQGYLDSHPAIGYWRLLKALEDSMHVTCSKKAMETWFSHHAAITTKSDIADYEAFLLEQLATNPSIGYKAMCTAIKKAKGVTFKEAPYPDMARNT